MSRRGSLPLESLFGIASFVCLLVAGWLAVVSAARSVDQSSVSQLARPIQELQVGDEVWGENPGQPDDLTLGNGIDPPNWRKLTLDAPKKDGSRADVTLLRPVAWLREQVEATEGAFDPESVVGQVVTISVPECGIDGEATLLKVEPCPAVKSTRGRIVIGKFVHHGAQVIDLRLAGQAEVIGTTPNHPFSSVDRQEFVRADELRAGDRLQRLDGGETAVTSATERLGRHTVYNLEVHREHVYHVASSGVLVHNTGDKCPDGFVSLDNFGRAAREAAEIHGIKPPTRSRRGDLRKAMGTPPDGMTKAEAHHDLPWTFRNWFAQAGRGLNVNDPDFGRWIPQNKHRPMSDAFNREWARFILDNPGASRQQVLKFMNDLRADPRFQ